MIDPKLLDELGQRLHARLPAGLQVLRQDLDDQIKAALSAALSRLDLVTREEFEVQARVLARTRTLVDELAARVAELEDRQRPDDPATPRDPSA